MNLNTEMNANPFLIDLFNFIDRVQISGSLGFPLRGDIYDPNLPFAYRMWYTVELRDQLINGIPEDKFQIVAIEKAEQTLASINLDILNKAKNIAAAMDRYLSAIREIDSKLDHLKTRASQEIIFNSLEDVQQTPQGNIQNLEFTHHKTLFEFLRTKVLMWLRQNLDDNVKVLRHTSTYPAFLSLLNEKMEVKPPNELTHRQHALIRKYQIEAKYIENVFIRIDITQKYGKARERAIDSVNEASEAYREIKAKEIESILPFLGEYPNAKKIAINHLDRINHNL